MTKKGNDQDNVVVPGRVSWDGAWIYFFSRNRSLFFGFVTGQANE